MDQKSIDQRLATIKKLKEKLEENINEEMTFLKNGSPLSYNDTPAKKKQNKTKNKMTEEEIQKK
ncbi:hypothetical protein [Oceanobacillus picturae]|uniref:hypothetical protein n=1 Tax=Oceanobacillus picturae TaxID=171693 RepID=UPI0009E982CA|nr:hypothetical protein [Oceanobacillus picturae]